MNKFKTLLTLLILLVTQAQVNAAVNSVTYKLVYNSTTCMYDVFMTITSGSTTSIQEQEAYTAQVTIVVPTGATVGTGSIVNNEPKLGSNSGGVLTRTTPKAWTNSNTEINHANLAGYDAYSFIPSLTNAYYGTLNTNDSILLFSIPISTTTCGSGIRMWKNNEIQGSPVAGGDPESIDFDGLDYNNGHDFSSSSVYQAYVGNGTSYVAPPKPSLTLTPTYIGGVSFADTSSAAAGSVCSGSLSYSWVGPNAFTATTPHIYVAPITGAHYGTYTLTVTDALGCSSSDFSSISSALPVNLISFDVVPIKCTTLLNWEVAGEVNCKQFDVQYSTDGNQFVTIGNVGVKKNPDETEYSFSFYQENKKGYYRLKMVDLDGNYSVSQVLSVTTQCDVREISVSPNPTTGTVKVSGINAGDQVRVVSMLGKVILTSVATGSSATFDLSAYPAGMYNVLIIQNQEVKKTTQLVKQ